MTLACRSRNRLTDSSMKPLIARAAVGCLLLAIACSTGRAWAADISSPGVGSNRIADFTLNDHAGAKRSFSEWKDKEVVVVVFLGTECPLAKLYAQRLADVDQKYAGRGVQVIGINSNQQDTLQEIAGFANEFNIEFPMLKDPGAKIADQFGATRTPEAFVLDRERIVRYHGRIDDQYAVGAARKRATKSEVVDAIEALLNNEAPKVAVTEPVGCLIGRRSANKTASRAGPGA